MIFGAYCTWLALGNTIYGITVKSGTIKGYLKAASDTVQANRQKLENKKYPDPRIDINTAKTCSEIDDNIKEIQRWENIPRRRAPMTKGMLKRLAVWISTSLFFSLLSVLFDWFVLGLHVGFRRSEYAQQKGCQGLWNIELIPHSQYPKALLDSDFEFFGHNRRRMTHAEAIAAPLTVESVDICWRYQKNKNHGEKKTVVVDRELPLLCGVLASIRIIDRARKLNLPPGHPVCVYTDDGTVKGNVCFVTETHIKKCMRSLAREEYSITDKDELQRYSSHSVRVGAAVALHAAGLDKMEIQHALRWRSTTFWNYLRNLPCQAARCMAAIRDYDPMVLPSPFIAAF